MTKITCTMHRVDVAAFPSVFAIIIPMMALALSQPQGSIVEARITLAGGILLLGNGVRMMWFSTKNSHLSCCKYRGDARGFVGIVTVILGALLVAAGYIAQ